MSSPQRNPNQVLNANGTVPGLTLESVSRGSSPSGSPARSSPVRSPSRSPSSPTQLRAGTLVRSATAGSIVLPSTRSQEQSQSLPSSPLSRRPYPSQLGPITLGRTSPSGSILPDPRSLSDFAAVQVRGSPNGSPSGSPVVVPNRGSPVAPSDDQLENHQAPPLPGVVEVAIPVNTQPQDRRDVLQARRNLHYGVNGKGPDTYGNGSSYMYFRFNWPGFSIPNNNPESDNQLEAAIGVCQSSLGDGSCQYNSLAKNIRRFSTMYTGARRAVPMFRNAAFLESPVGQRFGTMTVGQFFDLDFCSPQSLSVLPEIFHPGLPKGPNSHGPRGGNAFERQRLTYIKMFKEVMRRALTEHYMVSQYTLPSNFVLEERGFTNQTLPLPDDCAVGPNDEDPVYIPIQGPEALRRMYRNHTLFVAVMKSHLKEPMLFAYNNQSPGDKVELFKAVGRSVATGDIETFRQILTQTCLMKDAAFPGIQENIAKRAAMTLAYKRNADMGITDRRPILTNDDLQAFKKWEDVEFKHFGSVNAAVQDIMGGENLLQAARTHMEDQRRANYEKAVAQKTKEFELSYGASNEKALAQVRSLIIDYRRHNLRMKNDKAYSDFIKSPSIMGYYQAIHGKFQRFMKFGFNQPPKDNYDQYLTQRAALFKMVTPNSEVERAIVFSVFMDIVRAGVEAQRNPPIPQMSDDLAQSLDGVTFEDKPQIPTYEEYSKALGGYTNIIETMLARNPSSDNEDLMNIIFDAYFTDGADGESIFKQLEGIFKTMDQTVVQKLQALKEAIKAFKAELVNKAYFNPSDQFTSWTFDKILQNEINELLNSNDSDGQPKDTTLLERLRGYINVRTGRIVTDEELIEMFSVDPRVHCDENGRYLSKSYMPIGGDEFGVPRDDQAYSTDLPLTCSYYQLDNGSMFSTALPYLTYDALRDQLSDGEFAFSFGNANTLSYIAYQFNCHLYMVAAHENFLHIINKCAPRTQPNVVSHLSMIDFINNNHFQSVGILIDNDGTKEMKSLFPETHLVYGAAVGRPESGNQDAHFRQAIQNVNYDYRPLPMPGADDTLIIDHRLPSERGDGKGEPLPCVYVSRDQLQPELQAPTLPSSTNIGGGLPGFPGIGGFPGFPGFPGIGGPSIGGGLPKGLPPPSLPRPGGPSPVVAGLPRPGIGGLPRPGNGPLSRSILSGIPRTPSRPIMPPNPDVAELLAFARQMGMPPNSKEVREAFASVFEKPAPEVPDFLFKR